MKRYLQESDKQVYLLNEKHQQMFCWKSPTMQLVQNGQMVVLANYCSDACPMFAYTDIETEDPITGQIKEPPFPTVVSLHCTSGFSFDADYSPSKPIEPDRNVSPSMSANEFMSSK